MRAEALLTGARYLFLTDDSGVGHAHAEPHIPYYDVQRLDSLMVRMVAMEVSGRPMEDQIVRRVRQAQKAAGGDDPAVIR